MSSCCIDMLRINSIDGMQELTIGNFANALSDSKPESSSTLIQILNFLQQKILADHTEYAQEMLTVKQLHIALDALSIGIMIADNQRNITYANKTVREILQPIEATIRQRIPHFNVDKVIGLNIDIFHQVPAHQANLVRNLTEPYTGGFKLGGKHNIITVTPIINNNQQSVGTVAEWHDHTIQKIAEQEVMNMINNVSNADFTTRINTKDKTGFYKDAGQSINAIIDIFDAWLKEILRVFSGIESGDLTKKNQ